MSVLPQQLLADALEASTAPVLFLIPEADLWWEDRAAADDWLKAHQVAGFYRGVTIVEYHR